MSAVDPALVPPDEAARLAAVRRYEILDTPPDGAFDRITGLAARLFDVPIAIVSIVDNDRIWFKSHHGLDITQIDREPGLCASAILQHQPWVVNDAPRDARTLANPLVASEFGLGFYAGIPLRTADGYNLGTLCILDFKPRELSAEDTVTLQDLAAMVMSELELRLASRRAVSEANERNYLKDALVGMLSHELRTPVTTIYAGAQLLARNLELMKDERAREVFPDMISEADRLVRLIENLLVMTRLDQGQGLDPSREPVLIQRVLALAIEEEARRWPERVISLHRKPNLPPVLGDQLFVEQVFRNLLSNALKYSPAHEPVDVFAETVGSEVEVRVRDRGIGVGPEARETIFDLLTRTEEATRYAPGAGIGLYVCRQLLAAMGGRIWVDPAPDVGSVFTIRLPAAAE
ncbi:MAG TPA: ATP-binding protein [Candidatus Limnocylindria bacterium]|nr:ATP-binding protein [Candidatus Limnocylindria bacterium]